MSSATPPRSQEDRIERILGTVERLQKDIYSPHPDRPGLMMRLDRLERQGQLALKVLGWLGGGGLAGLFATAYLLWRVMEALGKIGVQGAQ